MEKQIKGQASEQVSEELKKLIDQAGNFGDGFENVDEHSLKQNFLLLLTPLSTIVQDDEEGKHKEGDFYLTGEDENLGSSIDIVPVGYVQRFSCWSGRKDDRSSTLIRVYTREELEKEVSKGTVLFKALGSYETLEGFPIIEEHVLFLHIDGRERGAMFICSSTKITPLKDWISKMRNKKVDEKVIPIFLQKWRLTSIKDENRKGQKYSNIGRNGKINADYLGVVDSETFTSFISEARKNVNVLFEKMASTSFLPEKTETSQEDNGEPKKWD